MKNNKHKDLVTIVTVTYNAENLLEETLLSVINQSYKNIEYIIIDGASTDKTIDIIKKYEDKINYWVSEPDDGIYFAMNKAIEKATGEWINFMNAGDTFFDLNTIQDIMNLKSADAELLYGNLQFKGSKTQYRAQDKSKWYEYLPFNHQTLFTTTSLMKEFPFNTCYRIAADQDFMIRMFHAEKNFFYIDRIIVLFSPGGYTSDNHFLSCVESLQVLLNNGVNVKSVKKSHWYNVIINDSEIVATQKMELKNLNKLYYHITNSKSWRLTAPLRKFIKLLKKIF